MEDTEGSDDAPAAPSTASSANPLLEYLVKLDAVREWIGSCFRNVGLEIELEADLNKGLKNGILLCYLAQYFEPNCIPRIHETAETQTFKFRENIVFFLAACEMLGVAKNRLFRVNDLWEGHSTVNVVECLAALADAVAARSPGKFPEFQITDRHRDSAAALLQSLSEAERMDIVRQLAARTRVTQSPLRRLTQGYRLSLRDVGGEVAQLMRQLHLEREAVMLRGVKRLQAVYRATRERQVYQNKLRDSAYRERVVFEVLHSEQTYVESLEVCIELYLKPLQSAFQSGKPILKEERIQSIFRNIETVASANRAFLAQLEARLQKWHPNLQVADVFEAVDSFVVENYVPYVQGYTDAVRDLKDAQRKKKNFKEFLSKQKNDPKGKGRELEQYLIMPVQRIPRYQLLLKELSKHTWATHPDFAALDKGVEKLGNIAMHLNERKREAEALQRTFHVQEILDAAGVNLQVALSGRRYVMEGELYDVLGKAVVAYLFNDLIVLCRDYNDRQHTEADERRVNKKKLKFLESLTLDPEMTVVDIGEADGRQPAFAVNLTSQRRALQLHCPSVALKKEWMDAIKALQPKLGSNAPPLPEGSSPGITQAKTRNSKRSSGRSHSRQRSVGEAFSDLMHAEKANSLPLGLPPSTPPVPGTAEKRRGFLALASPRSERPKLDLGHESQTSNSSLGNSAKDMTPSGSASSLISDESPAQSRPPRSGRKQTWLSSKPTTISNVSTPEGADNDEFEDGSAKNKGSIRKHVAAVMRLTNLTKLWDKDEEGGAASGTQGSSPVTTVVNPLHAASNPLHTSSSSTPNASSAASSPAPATPGATTHGGNGSVEEEREDRIATKKSSDMEKLSLLMKGRQPRKHNDLDEGSSSRRNSQPKLEESVLNVSGHLAAGSGSTGPNGSSE